MSDFLKDWVKTTAVLWIGLELLTRNNERANQKSDERAIKTLEKQLKEGRKDTVLDKLKAFIAEKKKERERMAYMKIWKQDI
jgi:methionine salvage enolase-phosphatase E1